MHTWTIAVDENGYTLQLASELPAFLVDENRYDFQALEWPWTKTNIPVGKKCGRNRKGTRLNPVARTSEHGVMYCLKTIAASADVETVVAQHSQVVLCIVSSMNYTS